jgi:hypothetical protein
MKKLIFFLLILCIAGCKEKYDLPFTPPVTGYLVIEGVINSGPDSTRIELSRTNKINSIQKQYEKGAIVQVEGNDNSTRTLFESGTGIYTGQLNLHNPIQYRMRIKTLAGKEYLSDFVDVKTTPAIDSISWERESSGVRLYFNTHDPQNNTRYYQWDYRETWEFHSAFKSVFKYTTRPGPGGQPLIAIGYRDPINYNYDTSIFKCWRSANSTNILLGSTAKLASGIIYKQPFLFIPSGDRRLSELYSIYVRQYALTKEGYEFLEKMKKNTEENGSIFDPQPSQLKGNIRCVTNPDEPVIGYISISTVTEKRIFISKSQVPLWNFRTDCLEVEVRNNPDSINLARASGLVPTNILETFGLSILYYGASVSDCVDCTLSGTNVKPPFWP